MLTYKTGQPHLMGQIDLLGTASARRLATVIGEVLCWQWRYLLARCGSKSMFSSAAYKEVWSLKRPAQGTVRDDRTQSGLGRSVGNVPLEGKRAS